MSDGDVSLIRDEDVLRRMWQQTEDFSRKKEIRAHMYRLREERLRNLYSPEPAAEGKGCEFTSSQGHVKSFADQTFQSMKSKEVRDAGSPPKEFNYHGQDLKELSNAGWTVESEKKTTDDGHTHVKSVHANIEGKYDVEGGSGQFAAVDRHDQAVTEYNDDNSSLKRNESSSTTAAREQVVRQTDDGTQVSSTTSSSTSTSKFQQVSSTKTESVPYLTSDDYDQSRQTSYDTNKNEQISSRRNVTHTEDYDNCVKRSELESGDLVSRKIEYPDDNSKIIVETRCLPDGTRVTSTRREFRAPAVHTTSSERHSQKSRDESYSSYSSSQQQSNIEESSKFIHDTTESHISDIVNSQKHIDDYDFKRKQTDFLQSNNNFTVQDTQFEQRHVNQESELRDYEIFRPDISATQSDQRTFDSQNIENIQNIHERVDSKSCDKSVDKKIYSDSSSDQYQTTYQTDYTQKKKISNDWSPTHQAWASTLRSDTPAATRPSTRASSPGGRTLQSSTSSLRSSISPDKTYKKPPSRGGSPAKKDKYSPTRNVHSTHSENNSNRYTSPERRPSPSPKRNTLSPDRKLQNRSTPRSSPDKQSPEPRQTISPEGKIINRASPTKEFIKTTYMQPNNQTESPVRVHSSPERKPNSKIDSTTKQISRECSPTPHINRKVPSTTLQNVDSRRISTKDISRHSMSPERNPTNLSTDQNLKSSSPISFDRHKSPTRSSPSPDRKPSHEDSHPHKPTTECKEKLSFNETKDTSYKHRIERSSSPDKKQVLNRSSVSPDKKTTDHYTSPSYAPNSKSNLPASHKIVSPSRPYSNDRTKISSDTRGKSPSPPTKASTHEGDNNRISPERKPNYMQPTAASKNNAIPINLKKSPSPEQKPTIPKSILTYEESDSTSKINKFTHDHYTYIDEETKVFSGINEDVHMTTTTAQVPQKSSISLSHDSSDTTDYCSAESPSFIPRPTLRKDSRSPSPPKGPVTFNQENFDTNYQTTSTQSSTKEATTDNTVYNDYKVETNRDSGKKNTVYKEHSPVTFGTYNKKDRHAEQLTEPLQETTYSKSTNIHNSKQKCDLKPSDASILPTKEKPRSSYSPAKENRYKHTTDFIETERFTENVSKERPRQLVTPSTSPTRKPKSIESAPSTGQSSPTSLASGFVYFSSSKTDNTIVTDLDDVEMFSETNIIDNKTEKKRPESLNIKRSPSPSKIPCRSPTHETVDTPTTTNLRRKSSLKKPTSNNNEISPVEKPPSNFKISPASERENTTEHKVVKKDQPEKEKSDTTKKLKPPLERRETYDERCRKILGMIDDNTTTDKNGTFSLEQPNSNERSPSVSPCYSSKNFEELTSVESSQQHEIKNTSSKVNKNDYDKHSNKYVKKIDRNDGANEKSKTPSRSSSPTKPQHFIDQTKHVKRHDSKVTLIDQKTFDNTNHVENAPNQKLIEKRPITGILRSPSPTKHQYSEESKDFGSSQLKSPPKTTTKVKLNRDSSPSMENTVEEILTDATSKFVSSKKISESTKDNRPLSPAKIERRTTSDTEFISLEKEQEILERVQKSLRSLSPKRNEVSPVREKSPSKSTTSLQDLDILTSDSTEVSNKFTDITNKHNKEEIDENKSNTDRKLSKILKTKQSDTKISEKVTDKKTSRNVSPIKKIINANSQKVDINSDTPTKNRSVSPKKNMTIERPQSPQTPKASSIKPRETISSNLVRKSAPVSPTKSEKSPLADVKKNTKQNSFSKTLKTVAKATSVTVGKTLDTEIKRTSTPNDAKGNTNFKKIENNVNLPRASSDATIKLKKPSPQRVRSKPEIQVNDMCFNKNTKQSTTNNISHKSTMKEPYIKFPSKPKSATALNTTTDEDDIIIDVQQAKSSRENSPERICPTPVGFTEDVGTPRFPDEINEPDDEFRKKTYTIHETESIVDDIVEICEDDELFVKKTNVNLVTGSDECLLSVNDKVSKFTNKIDTVNRSKESTSHFKDTEKRVHSDFASESLKSDECLLSVSEKVNKFAKGPQDGKDRKSPSRRIIDEYDTTTVYQDDYTKLSVNDKAHLFVETAENIKAPKVKPVQKIERPDMSNIDDSLQSDDCLLSVSDKVNKFVKTAEHFLSDTQEVENKERKIKEQHDEVMKIIANDDLFNLNKADVSENLRSEDKTSCIKKSSVHSKDDITTFSKETTSSHAKDKKIVSPNLKSTEKSPTVKITTLRSSEAIKKAKALFENIASTNKQQSKEIPQSKTTKLTDIGVVKMSPKTDSTVVYPIVKDGTTNISHTSNEIDSVSNPSQPKDRLTSENSIRPHHLKSYDNISRSPNYLGAPSPDASRKSPLRQTLETSATSKTKFLKHEAMQSPESKRFVQEKNETLETPQERVPGYQKPTKTSQTKIETKVLEETEVSSRRGSGKFGVELRRTSVERSTTSSERRRSVEHPCIEDIFDLDLLEQMLEKVVGYEQRRRIRAQIRIAKKKTETEHISNIGTELTKPNKNYSHLKNRSPVRHTQSKSPERKPKSPSQKPVLPENHVKSTEKSPDRSTKHKPILNGHTQNENTKTQNDKYVRTHNSEKVVSKTLNRTKSPTRHTSPDKKTRPLSPQKTTTPKSKQNRFNEYASAYMKKVGLNDKENIMVTESRSTKSVDDQKNIKEMEECRIIETKETSTTISKNSKERTSSKDFIEIINVNGKRSHSPEKKQGPEGRYDVPMERRQRSPSPHLKRQRSDPSKKETIIKTVLDLEKKIPTKQTQEDKPSWVTNRNLKKITSETRTFSNKKIESDKPKYRAPSPSKVITRPTDVITSSYGPGPLDADGKPLFGIRALRNGATNFQVKGTVIRQEYHSRDGGEPEGTVSVTAYSSEPAALEQLLSARGDPPSRLHGLAAITTTKQFGGRTGTTLKEAHTKEERAELEQFTHQDRRVTSSRTDNTMERSFENRGNQIEQVKKDGRVKGQQVEEIRERTVKKNEEKKTVRQSSVKSLTEKYIKSASETSKSERGTYPKAGLILRTATMRDSVSSDSSAHAGLARTDSEHSLGSMEDRDGGHVTTNGASTRGDERSFLGSNTKVTGVQDILTRMKNADIVIQEGDTTEDTEARALLNKFLGATVLMAGMQNYVSEKPSGKIVVKQETVRSSGGKTTTNRSVEEFDLEQCWDERVLRKLLDECSDYEQRRRLRARIRTLMAEQEACASAVTEALAAAGETAESAEGAESGDAREEEEVTTVTSSVRRNSSEKTVSSSITTKTSKAVTDSVRGPKPVSPFAKFRQLEKQNSTNSPNSPKTPQSPGSPQAPYFKFTDPAVHASALTIKERLLQWCRDKTRDYENVKLENFSTSWADGLAFCALVHHFLPTAFDYSKLTPDKRRHNFTLAFKVADEKAGIYPLLDVDDMVAMRKPDWKCVFTYVQSIHRRFKDQD